VQARSKPATDTAKPPRTRFKLVREIISELKKVVWLSRREAIYLTLLVILLSVAVGIILGAFDFGFVQLAQKVFLAGK
jgi:preprotein translocase SecE subunit